MFVAVEQRYILSTMNPFWFPYPFVAILAGAVLRYVYHRLPLVNSGIVDETASVLADCVPLAFQKKV